VCPKGWFLPIPVIVTGDCGIVTADSGDRDR
jgi:hypothetical protein